MTEQQAWTLIAGFLSIMVAHSGLLLRLVRLEIQTVHVGIDGVDRRLETLDRDVHRLVDQHYRDQP